MTIPMPGPSPRALLSLAAVFFTLAGCSPTDSAPVATGPAKPAGTATTTRLAPLLPTATEFPSVWPITEPGCCARPWWADDGSRLFFLDDPPGVSPLGIYGVSANGGPVVLEEPVFSSADLGRLIPPGDFVSPGPDVPPPPSGAASIRLARGGDRLAWTLGGEGVANLDLRQRSVWLSGQDGGPPLQVGTLQGGGLIGWAAHDAGLVVTGRIDPVGPSGVWFLPIRGGEPTLLVEGRRPRGAALSPSGRWIAVSFAFEEDPGRNALWVADTTGGPVRTIPGWASYRWAGDQLHHFPFDPSVEQPALQVLDPATGLISVALEGGFFPGGIANNEWEPSPLGDRIVYRSRDGGLWVQSVPGG